MVAGLLFAIEQGQAACLGNMQGCIYLCICSHQVSGAHQIAKFCRISVRLSVNIKHVAEPMQALTIGNGNFNAAVVCPPCSLGKRAVLVACIVKLAVGIKLFAVQQIANYKGAWRCGSVERVVVRVLVGMAMVVRGMCRVFES